MRILKMIETAFRRRSAPADAPPVWQRVETGPLRGLEFFLPQDLRSKSWNRRIVQGDYEPSMVAALAGSAGSGGVLFDVGGHVGFFACAWVHLGGAFVEVFEPVPSSAERIRSTLERNGFPERSRVHEIALSDAVGEATMVINEGNLGLVSMSYLEGSGGTPKMRRQHDNRLVTVRTSSLDRLCGERVLPSPDIIKIDVEGAEGRVVAGARETIDRCRPLVMTELHGTRCAVEVAAELGQMGFQPHAVGDRDAGMPVYLWVPDSDGAAQTLGVKE